MIRPVFVLMAILSLTGSASAVSFDEANKLYEDARLADAAAAYESLITAHPDSAVLHYNLGNAYFRQASAGTLGRAIAAYARAYELAPRDADTRHNLEFALMRSGEKLVPEGTPKILFLAYRFLSQDELAALSFLGLWATLLIGSIWISKEHWQERLKTPLIASAAVLTVFSAWWGARQLTGLKDPAVVLAADSEARSGPGTTFPVSFKVPEGRRVTRLDRKGDWVEIGVLQEGLKGWMDARALKGIRKD